MGTKPIKSVKDLNEVDYKALQLFTQGYRPAEIAALMGRKPEYIKHFFEKYPYENRSFFNRIEGIKTEPQLIEWFKSQTDPPEPPTYEQLLLGSLNEKVVLIERSRRDLEWARYAIMSGGGIEFAFESLQFGMRNFEQHIADIEKYPSDLRGDFYDVFAWMHLEICEVVRQLQSIEHTGKLELEMTRRLIKLSERISHPTPLILAVLTQGMYHYGRREYLQVVEHMSSFNTKFSALGNLLTPYWIFISARLHAIALAHLEDFEGADRAIATVENHLAKAEEKDVSLEYVELMKQENQSRLTNLKVKAGKGTDFSVLPDFKYGKYYGFRLVLIRSQLEGMFLSGDFERVKVKALREEIMNFPLPCGWYKEQALGYADKILAIPTSRKKRSRVG